MRQLAVSKHCKISTPYWITYTLNLGVYIPLQNVLDLISNHLNSAVPNLVMYVTLSSALGRISLST
jgi:hypothetical protein